MGKENEIKQDKNETTRNDDKRKSEAKINKMVKNGKKNKTENEVRKNKMEAKENKSETEEVLTQNITETKVDNSKSKTGENKDKTVKFKHQTTNVKLKKVSEYDVQELMEVYMNKVHWKNIKARRRSKEKVVDKQRPAKAFSPIFKYYGEWLKSFMIAYEEESYDEEISDG